MTRQLLLLLLLSSYTEFAPAVIIHVPGDQPTIQAGIDAAVNGDTVLVAEGYYRGPGNTDLDFSGKAILLTSETGREYCFIDCEGNCRGASFRSGEGAGSVLKGFTIRNGFAERGGGIFCDGASPTITNNVISSCEATDDGGGIYCNESSLIIDNTIITSNRVDLDDVGDGTGGIHLAYSDAVISNCVIADNDGVHGGGVNCWGDSTPYLFNCLIIRNTAIFIDDYGYVIDGIGGAINGGAPLIENCTIAGNTDSYGSASVRCSQGTITNSIIWENGDIEISAGRSVSYCDVLGGYEGEGNIDTDPLFVALYDWTNNWYGSFYFFLSQSTSGQSEESPCVDAGSAPAETVNLDTLTTRTDFENDTGKVDIGYHYPGKSEAPDTRILSGPFSEVVDSPVLIFTYTGEDDSDPPSALHFSYQMDEGVWSEYSPETRTVIHTSDLTDTQDSRHYFRVRSRDTDGNLDPNPDTTHFFVGELNLDLWSGVVTGPGPGPNNPPLVRTSEAEWLAYGVMEYGVNVACANLDGDGFDEVITGPGPGPPFGPHVRGWTLDGQPVSDVNFLAYGTNKFGVNVAAGDLDADGYDEIITGAGPGAVFGPHVRGWNYDNTGSVTAMNGVNFFAYGTPKWGVNVAAGDVDGDGYDEIITGAGPGSVYGPHVRGWNCDGAGPATPIPSISYFAYGTLKWGVNVACGDLDGDGDAEIISGAGPSSSFGAHVRAWDYDGVQIFPVKDVSFFAYYDSLFGVRVAAGDVDGDGMDEILTVTGPSPDFHANVRVWSVNSSKVTMDLNFGAYDRWMTHGGTIAGGHLN